MGYKLFVCNFPYATSAVHLTGIFSTYGKVNYVSIIRDKETNVPRGFGFVEMETEEGQNIAIEKLNGRIIAGRKLRVMEARERIREPIRPRGHIIGNGICIFCKKPGILVGYESEKGICGACAKIFRNIHFHYDKAKPYSEISQNEEFIECILDDQ